MKNFVIFIRYSLILTLLKLRNHNYQFSNGGEVGDVKVLLQNIIPFVKFVCDGTHFKM
jgi:hypothetical protein